MYLSRLGPDAEVICPAPRLIAAEVRAPPSAADPRHHDLDGLPESELNRDMADDGSHDSQRSMLKVWSTDRPGDLAASRINLFKIER